MKKVSIELFINDQPRYNENWKSFQVNHAIITSENGQQTTITNNGDPLDSKCQILELNILGGITALLKEHGTFLFEIEKEKFQEFQEWKKNQQ